MGSLPWPWLAALPGDQSAPNTFCRRRSGLLCAAVRFTTLTALLHHGQADHQFLCIGRWPMAPWANRTFVASQSGIFITHISNADQVGAPLAVQLLAADGTV